jgi:hypothetical protein
MADDESEALRLKITAEGIRMRLSQVMSIIVVLTASVAVAGCGSGQTRRSDGTTALKQVTMGEQQATERAETITHQAVDGMSPTPTLKRTGLTPLGTCLADDHSAGERQQIALSYQLTGVPGTDAKNLVRQARDAWVKHGYTFQTSDADWSDPFPSVSMRTVPDDFWMTALTGVVDKAKGEGLSTTSVTSPCIAASSSATANSASFRQALTNEQAEYRALDHSSYL